MSVKNLELDGVNHSVITNLADERKRTMVATYGVLSGAASYIIMLFVAMPISVHLIINIKNGCNPQNVDEACFSPTAASQTQFTLALTLLRLMTFLFGSLVGTISDRFGRRPMLISALCGYSLTGALFLIGWEIQSVELFFLGAICLGISSPITPHGIAYVSDISQPNRLATNLGVLQGAGYFSGLTIGALIALGISQSTTGAPVIPGQDPIIPYDRLFYLSYGIGLLFSASSAIMMFCFLPESLNKQDRATSIDIRKANPLGFLYMVTRNPYIFLVWLSLFAAWIGVGAGEAVTGGWWLRRYAVPNVSQFIVYIVILWTVSGFGAVIMTKIYTSVFGLKAAVHVSAMFTILVGVAFALAPDVNYSFIAVALSFFASSVSPATLAVLMGQATPKERGALAGAIRSSEALAKLIGIIIFGNAFASYIRPFTPSADCVPATFNVGGNKTNTCDCGVESCPMLFENTTKPPQFVPSICTLGQLSSRAHGKPSKTIPYLAGLAETRPIVPQAFIDDGTVVRDETCLGGGLLPAPGFTITGKRAWCAGFMTLQSREANEALGCPKFDAVAATVQVHVFTCATNNATICPPSSAQFNASAAVNGGQQVALWTALGVPSPQTWGPLQLPQPFVNTSLLSSVAAKLRTEETRLRTVNATLDLCKEYGPSKANACLAGPITSFPGFFPMMFMVVVGSIAWFFYIVAEVLFVSRDKRYWIEDSEANSNSSGADKAGDDVSDSKQLVAIASP